MSELAAVSQFGRTMTRNRWTVILAAGAGRRLAPVTGATPKQFWKAGLASSLLEDTVARMKSIAPPERTVVVVDRSHAGYLRSHPGLEDSASVLYQPNDRGTAAGVLFAIQPALQSDPGAIVVLTPSDQGVADAVRFRRGILNAARHVCLRGDIVLFGVQPDDCNDDYGWIVKDRRRGRVGGHGAHLFHVAQFVEKPSREHAEALLASGALWNTMVLVARARDLERLFLAATPELVMMFDDAQRVSAELRPAFYTTAYSRMPVRDFSRDVLGATSDLVVYEWPASLGWSDLGTPDRLLRWRTHHRDESALGAA